MMGHAIELTSKADVVMIIGTSMQVYPAASLINFTMSGIPIYFIDPKPSIEGSSYHNITVIPEKASKGVPIAVADLIDKVL